MPDFFSCLIIQIFSPHLNAINGSNNSVGVGDGIIDSVGDSVDDGADDSIGDGVGVGDGDGIGDGIDDGVGVGDGIGDGVDVGDGMGDGVGDTTIDGVGDDASDGVSDGIIDGVDDIDGIGDSLVLGPLAQAISQNLTQEQRRPVATHTSKAFIPEECKDQHTDLFAKEGRCNDSLYVLLFVNTTLQKNSFNYLKLLCILYFCVINSAFSYPLLLL